jgi:Transposase DDE domain
MGGSLEMATGRVAAVPAYRREFQHGFSSPDVTFSRIAAAIATFEQTIVSWHQARPGYSCSCQDRRRPSERLSCHITSPVPPIRMKERGGPFHKRGEATGPNPTDWGKAGTKRHIITDQHGVPLAFLLTGANVHDSVPFEDLLDGVPFIGGRPGRPRHRPDKLHADKAYDHRRCRRACHRRRITPRIARRGIESS